MRSWKRLIGLCRGGNRQFLPISVRRVFPMGKICSFCLIIELGAFAAFAADPSSANQESANSAKPDDVPDRRELGPKDSKRFFTTPAKVNRYALYILKTYDENGDGLLQPDEWKKMHGRPERMDRNGDGIVDFDELTKWFSDFGRRRHLGHANDSEEVSNQAVNPRSNATTDPADGELNPESTATNSGTESGDRKRDQKYYVSPKRQPAGLPEWFSEHDQDGDGQLTFSEFAPNGGAAELTEFEKYDVNGDGLVTGKEFTQKGNNKSASGSKSGTDQPNGTDKATPKRKRTKRGQPMEQPAAP